MKRSREINSEVYDLIVVGAGAAGLFAGASIGSLKVLLLEKKPRPGRKLLATGGGQCNLTNAGNIKDFINHYGQNGPKIRPILYKFNNLALMDFFQSKGLPLVTQEDGKVYPKSLKAQDVLNVLLTSCQANGIEIKYSSPVTNIAKASEFFVVTVNSESESQEMELQFWAKKVLVTTGGSSFPTTGSDGSLFPVLENLGLKIVTPKPALTPISVENYPYSSLSGISIENIAITIDDIFSKNKKDMMAGRIQTGDLLFTHDCFSGPAILNASRYANPGTKLSINYIPEASKEKLFEEFDQISKERRLQLDTCLYKSLNKFKTFPRNFCDLICQRANLNPKAQASQINKSRLNALFDLVVQDNFSISGTKGFKTAMVTAGGLSLDEVNLKTLESLAWPGLYFAGEVLDVDGDTGGYNLQFAFSSARLAADATLLYILKD